MKVATLTSGVRGLATYALNQYNYFERTGEAETLVITSSKWRKQPIRVHELDAWLIGKVLPWPKRIREATRTLEEYGPDILHHHHPAGRLDFNVAKLKRRMRVPMVTTVHMSVGSRKYFVDRIMNGFFIASRRNLAKSDCYVAISRYVKKQLEEMGGLPKERIVLLYAGVDEKVFTPLPRNAHETLEIAFVGQIMHEKGIDLLIDTVIRLAKERKVRLRIIGEGTLKAALQLRTRNHPEIVWVGYLNSQAKVAEFYAKSDVVVLPNRWDEAFSYIPLESMSSGTAVIASRVGGNGESIVDGKTGLLFEVGNEEQLYRLLRDTTMEQFWDMGRAGRDHVLEHFTLDRFGAKYKRLYDNLMTNPDVIEQID